jgi:hypothetical protein
MAGTNGALTHDGRDDTTRERDVLRCLLGDRVGAVVLWDDELHLAWASVGAAQLLQGRVLGRQLERAATLAARRLPGPDSGRVSLREHLRTDRGDDFVAELRWIGIPGGRPGWWPSCPSPTVGARGWRP